VPSVPQKKCLSGLLCCRSVSAQGNQTNQTVFGFRSGTEV
jgi:hypothetical protein